MKSKIPAKYSNLFYRMSNDDIIKEIQVLVPRCLKNGVTSEDASYARALRKEMKNRNIRVPVTDQKTNKNL